MAGVNDLSEPSVSSNLTCVQQWKGRQPSLIVICFAIVSTITANNFIIWAAWDEFGDHKTGLVTTMGRGD